MRKFNLFLCCLTVIVLGLNSCEETDYSPEQYGEYLTMEITSINDNIEDSIYQIQIFNSQNKTFEKDCKLVFSLTHESSEYHYTAETNIANKKIPDDPSLGYLNLQGGGHFTLVTDINQLNWIANNINYIETGNYELRVSLIIDDPSSPYNKIHSNTVSLTKN